MKQAAESSRGASSATKASAVGSLQDSKVQEDPLGDAPKKMVICSPRKYDGASFRPTFPTSRLRIKQKRHELVCFVRTPRGKNATGFSARRPRPVELLSPERNQVRDAAKLK